MELSILGTGSSGNQYLLKNNQEVLMIECGIPFKYVKQHLNHRIDNIVGCLLSHSHMDHSKYIDQAIDNGINVYSGKQTFEALKISGYPAKEMGNKLKYKIGSFEIMPFDVKHDVPCYGFLINHPESGKILFATDTSYIPYTFSDINNIVVEVNYDMEILNYNVQHNNLPWFVRDRIIKSHMSFDTFKGFLNSNDLSKVKNIVIIHLSDGNSNAEKFKNEIISLTGIKTIPAEKGQIVNFNERPF